MSRPVFYCKSYNNPLTCLHVCVCVCSHVIELKANYYFALVAHASYVDELSSDAMTMP